MQLWCLRAVLSLSLQCPAARTFMLAPMATILKRFLAIHATRAASPSADPKDCQAALALALQTLSSLCVSERSEASVGEGNKAADLIVKEGLADTIIQALKTYKQVHTQERGEGAQGVRGMRRSCWDYVKALLVALSLPLSVTCLFLPLCSCSCSVGGGGGECGRQGSGHSVLPQPPHSRQAAGTGGTGGSTTGTASGRRRGATHTHT